MKFLKIIFKSVVNFYKTDFYKPSQNYKICNKKTCLISVLSMWSIKIKIKIILCHRKFENFCYVQIVIVQ